MTAFKPRGRQGNLWEYQSWESFFFINLRVLVYLQVCMKGCGPEEDVGSPPAGITGSYEPPDMGAGN